MTYREEAERQRRKVHASKYVGLHAEARDIAGIMWSFWYYLVGLEGDVEEEELALLTEAATVG